MFFSSDPAVSSSIFVGAEREEFINNIYNGNNYINYNKGTTTTSTIAHLHNDVMQHARTPLPDQSWVELYVNVQGDGPVG